MFIIIVSESIPGERPGLLQEIIKETSKYHDTSGKFMENYGNEDLVKRSKHIVLSFFSTSEKKNSSVIKFSESSKEISQVIKIDKVMI